MKRLTVPPPLLFIGCAGLMWYLPPVYEFSANRYVIGFILLIAAGIAAGGLYQFYRANTTASPLNLDNTSVLVVTGVYAFSRNPMYLSLLLALIAWFLWLGAVSAIIGPLLFIGLMNYLQIKPEEIMLAKLFGAAYQAYCAKVRRWL
ncbi:methyltransferase family protein [Necropsobacter massiliensis]|uniref:methyltransferase family protein n=1 Tax=Necropsobacter massiliensis TaxID=1400001 RepID=UPI000ABF1F69|nr:isoprenylcysteine carboxylmethyltransferase family protein [Necropsobacter massiliensis]